MKRELYVEIIDFLKNLITGTEWEGAVFTVGGPIVPNRIGKRPTKQET